MKVKLRVHLLLALVFFNPFVLLGQIDRPSILLEVLPGAPGDIGGTVRQVGTAPSVIDLGAMSGGELVNSLPLAGSPQVNIEPLFDESEFPRGPRRVTLTYGPVTIHANTPFIPGTVGWVLPDRIGQTLTRESFLRRFLGDYILEVNGLEFSSSDLIKPENVVSTSSIDGAMVGLSGQIVQLWAVNFSLRLSAPGTYRIRNIMKIPKSEPEPEFNMGFLAGGLIIDSTIVIVPANSPTSALVRVQPAGDYWGAVAQVMRDIHEAQTQKPW